MLRLAALPCLLNHFDLLLIPFQYTEIYNSMKAHYNAWHAPSPTLDKKNSASRPLQQVRCRQPLHLLSHFQTGSSPFVVSSDLMRDRPPEPASPLKPEHRLLFATEERTFLFLSRNDSTIDTVQSHHWYLQPHQNRPLKLQSQRSVSSIVCET